MELFVDGARAVGGFVRRHRRALAVGVIGGAVVAGVIRARRAFDDATDMILEAEKRLADQQRRQQHLERVHQESGQALVNFLSALSSELQAVTGRVPTIMREIKKLRSSQLAVEGDGREAALWEELKVAIFTGFLTSFYAFNLLHLVLRLQLHILAREFYSSDGSDALNLEARGQLLSVTYKYMLGQGLTAMASDFQTVVAEVLAGYSFQTSLFTCDDLVKILESMRARVEGDAAPSEARSVLLRYVICPTDHTTGATTKVQQMLDETWDVVESPVFSAAVRASLDKSLQITATQLKQAVFSVTNTGLVDADAEATTPPPKPLAAVLPFLKPQKLVLQVQDGRCTHADAIAALPTVRDLCVAVFDSTEAPQAEGILAPPTPLGAATQPPSVTI